MTGIVQVLVMWFRGSVLASGALGFEDSVGQVLPVVLYELEDRDVDGLVELAPYVGVVRTVGRGYLVEQLLFYSRFGMVPARA